MKHFILLAWMLWSLCLATSVSAAEPTDLGNNAALKYWQAFAMLPKLSEDDRKAMASPHGTPVTKRMREIASKARHSLHLMHKGTLIGPCDWGHDLTEGFELLLPHCSKAREVTRLATLRARVRLADGDVKGAIDDLLGTMKLAHHLGHDGLLIEILVEWAIRSHVIETTASQLAAMTSAQRTQLAAGLRKLPPPTRGVVGIRTERTVGYQYIARLLRAGKHKEIALAISGGPPTDPAQKRVVEAVSKGLKDQKVVKKALQRWKTALDRVIRDADQPYPKSVQKIQAFEKELKQKTMKLRQNPKANVADMLICVLMPAVSKVLTAEANVIIHHTMLLAAIAYANGGKDAAAKVTDPLTGKPFNITPIKDRPGWIELASTVKRHGKPVTLRAQVKQSRQ